MKKNLNILEISASNYYSNINKNRALKKTEYLINSNIHLNKTSFNNKSSNIMRVSSPFKGIKSIKRINNNKLSINQQSYLSPNSKTKISFLNQFNNNSIYYSNNKNVKNTSYFPESKLNTEIIHTKNKLMFTETKLKKVKVKDIVNLQKTSIFRHREVITEDSKNNQSFLGYKNNNYIFSYNFFSNFNTEKKINENFLNTSRKPETTKIKLLKMISKKNLFGVENNSVLKKSSKNINNKDRLIKSKKKQINKNNPEVIKPGEYIKIRQLGEGSFGKIFKVKWIPNNKNYAMKEMHFQSEDNLLFLQKKVNFIIDFNKRTNCDGLIKIFGYSCIKKEKNYYFYEIMELAERDWEQEINMRKKLMKYYTEKELFSIATQLIKALSLLQQNKITHRDIKLQNILLVRDKYKICDFGESRTLNQKGNIVQPVRGSELYMSPILFSGLNQKLMHVTHNTYKSDMFSLGMCILFAASLDSDCLYEIREMNDMNKIRNILMKYLSRRYSNNFIEILLCMLEVKEKKRPDFIQLEKVFDLYENYNKIN